MTEPIKLPPEFRSGNSIPVERATITRERMIEILAETIEADRQARGEPFAWATHHDEPMLFPTLKEASAYCEDDEEPIPLFTPPQPRQIPEGYRLQPISEFDAMMDTRTIPEGYKLVPVEPTIEMCDAALAVQGICTKGVYHVYRAMLEAAPEPKGQ